MNLYKELGKHTTFEALPLSYKAGGKSRPSSHVRHCPRGGRAKRGGSEDKMGREGSGFQCGKGFSSGKASDKGLGKA